MAPPFSIMLSRVPEMAQVCCRRNDWLDHMVSENGVFLAMHTNLYTDVGFAGKGIKLVGKCFKDEAGLG